jgi:3-dehydroquinate dehydratase-1
MSNFINVRNVMIGVGMPKICAPIVSEHRESIMRDALQIKESKADIVEWRADYFDQILDMERVQETLKELRAVLGDMPLLFTIRTSNEGGNLSIDKETYLQINQEAIQTGFIDMVDVEVFMSDDVTERIVEKAHNKQVYVVGSNHDFHKTPKKEEIVDRLKTMQERKVDIPKIAVMPNSSQDVVALLSATNEMAEYYADRPIITMAMGKSGLISRLSGETFGSTVTFGAVGNISAPGQIRVEELKNILEQLHGGKNNENN